MYDAALTPLLERCTNAELDPLVTFLTSPMLSALERDPLYKRHAPDHRQYIDAIVKHIRLVAGHTILHRATSGPVGQDYYDALEGALRDLGIEKGAIPDLLSERETMLVKRCIDQHFEARPAGEQHELMQEFYDGGWYHEERGIRKRGRFDDYLERVPGQRRRLSPEKLARTVRQKTSRYVQDKIKGKIFKTGLKLVLKRAAGPLGLAIEAWSWLGPSWRVFVPTACYIAYLRRLKGMDTPEHEIISLYRVDAEE